MNAAAVTLLAVTLSSAPMAVAQVRISSDPELAALQQQNAILQEKINQLQIEKASNADPLTKQGEVIYEYGKLIAQERSLLNITVPQIVRKRPEVSPERGDDGFIESTRMAYTALSGIAPDIAKELDCGGKNIVLYGAGHSEALLSIRTFNDQLELLHSRLKSVLDLEAPSAPDQTGAGAGVYGVSALARPVLQSVLDLISLFHPGAALAAPDVAADETGLVAVLANAAAAQGCIVYWPDQYVVNPFNPGSQVLASLQAVADLNDNAGTDGKPAGLQHKIHVLQTELKRSEVMSQALAQKIETEQNKMTEASNKVEFLKGEIDFISGHIKDEKNAALQDKLNRTFEKSWEELEAAVKKQLVPASPEL